MSVVFREGGSGGRSGSIEIRRAGDTLRLYLGGVLSSWWNPRHALTGGYWDGLAAAALLSPKPCRSALVLGVGGGGVIHVLRSLAAPRSIVGVDIDREILDAARRHFPLDGKDARWVIADAFGFVRRRRLKFDLVVDDVYRIVGDKALRPEAAGRRWFDDVSRRVSDSGVLAVNFLDAATSLAAWPALESVLRRRFACAFRFTFEAYHNEVVAACRAPSSIARFEATLAEALSRRDLARRRFLIERLS